MKPRAYRRIAEPMPAAVILEIALGGLPARAPVIARVVVTKVYLATAQIQRCVVVTVACQPSQARVAVERIAAGRVRDDPEVRLAPEVVDPGQRSVGSRYDVFALFVVEM